MKKLIIVAVPVQAKLVLTVKRSFISKNIKSCLYDLYNEGNFEGYHALTQTAIGALQSQETMRQAFIDGYTAVFLGEELMKEVDEAIGADAQFELAVIQDNGEELARFQSHDLNY